MSTTSPARPWTADRLKLKRWLLIFLACWIGGAGAWILGAGTHVEVLSTFGVSIFIFAVVPYVVSLVHAYRVQKKLNEAGLYKPGAWQIIVGGLILNPWLLGFAIPVSVLSTVNRIQRSYPGPSA